MTIHEKETKILGELSKLGISYQTHRHEPVPTVEEMMKHLALIDGEKCKNLVLKDKKAQRKPLLLTASVESNVDMKKLTKRLGCGQLRMASDEILTQHLDVQKGAVNPLALFFDSTNAVEFFLDENLKGKDRMLIHPMHNEASISIKVSDVVIFCETHNHPVNWINLADDTPTPEKEGGSDTTHMLGITVKKSSDFSEWYTQTLVRSEMIDYYDISGCYIIRPWAYQIWEIVTRFFDEAIKKLGVENAYFPLFVSKHRLEAEASHVEGFSPEVAWVTKYGTTDLTEPIAIRPTSETIVYPSYAKWIRSHRDLPLKLNMWNAVVRWEFKQPTPFIRTREFLWQEGHTVHSTEPEAFEMVMQILDLYTKWYTDYLAVPVIPGTKSEGEKFAGGKKTMTIEGFIPETGRGIQAATSHLLGTNFSKMFGIFYEDSQGTRQLAHQTSWGCTTRTIGVMVMTHGDDKGLVLPPKVASVQVVLIPIPYKEEPSKELVEKCEKLERDLRKMGIRTKIDDRVNYTPGWKFNHWELKGVPIRCEVGSKELEKGTVRVVRRDTNEKSDFFDSSFADTIQNLLEKIQQAMYDKAERRMRESIVKTTKFEDVMPALNNKKLLLLPWCCEEATEAEIKQETARLTALQTVETDSQQAAGMKPLCIPLDQPPLEPGTKCFWTGKPAVQWSLWGRSY